MTSIIWDFDGTLANSYPGMVIAVQESLKTNFQIEISKDSIYKDIKKTSIRQYVTDLFTEKGESDEDVTRDVKIFYHDYKLLEKQYQDKIHLIPHAEKALKYLQKLKVTQFIVTHRDESIKELTEQLAIRSFFTEVVSVENGFERKPSSNMLDYLVSKYHLADDIYVIGDRKIDIDFGKSADAKTIYFSEQKDDFGQDYSITDLNQLADIFK